MDFMMTQYSPAPSEESDVGQLLPTVPAGCGSQTISLALLMDFAIQQTLHDLTILAEMLPIKEHSERKKSIVQFAHASRLLFAKLLGIVKWLRTSKKFEPLASINYFLDLQSNQFIETADRLCELARVELQKARLPLFQISTAIDVLTTGTFPRLPMVIKDAFVPEERLTPYETRQAILLLNERLVFYMIQAIPTLPKRVTMFRVHNGTIVMRVKGEFQLRLTVLPRKKPDFVLLSVAVLVNDYEIGGGMDLVHPLQLNALHEAIQVRISQSDEPFLEAYHIMHSFCLSLQLDVLECQTRKLSAEIAPNYIRVENYNPYAGFLVVRYWINEKSNTTQTRIQKLLSNSVQYKMKIFIDKNDPEVGLLIRHEPPSAVKMIDKLPSDRQLSMGRLVSEVIEIRIREKLLMVRQLLNNVPPGVKVHLAGDAAPTLIYELLVHETKSHLDEQLIVSINAFFGHVVCQVHCLGQIEELRNLEKELNGTCQLSEVTRIIKRLRVLLMIDRYTRAVSTLPVVQIIPEAQMPAVEKLKDLPKDRILMQFVREPNLYLVIGFVPAGSKGLQVHFQVINRKPDSKLIAMKLDPMQALNRKIIPAFYKRHSEKEEEPEDVKMEVDDEIPSCNLIGSDRKANGPSWNGQEGQVRQIIAALEDRIAFLRIAEELEKKGFGFEPVQIDPSNLGPFIRVTDMSNLVVFDNEDFFESIASVVLRMDSRRNLVWPVEYIFRDPPLTPNFFQNRIMNKLKVVPENTMIAKMVEYENNKNAAGSRHKIVVYEVLTSNFQSLSESVAINISDRLVVFSNLYAAVKRFSYAYCHVEHAIDVLAYTYHRFIIAYGPNRNYTMTVLCRTTQPQFAICLGSIYYDSLVKPKFPTYEKKMNPHLLIQPFLLEKFNADKDLIHLVNFMINTTISLECLTRLPNVRMRSFKAYHLMTQNDQPNGFPVNYEVFIVPVRDSVIRIFAGPVHLEFLLLNENAVTIKDVSPEKCMAIGLIPFLWSFKPVNDDYNPYPNLPAENNEQKIINNPECADDRFQMSRAPFHIPCRLLLRLCTNVDGKGMPLDNYLFALNFLARIGKSFSFHRDSGHIFHVPLSEISVQPDHFDIKTPTIPSKDQNFVTLSCYLCPEQYRLKTKLYHENPAFDVPNEIEMRILLRYFEQCVAPLMNECAVLSFLNLCRITYSGVFDSITRIMEAQMSPDISHFWRVSLQLAPLNIPSDASHTLGVMYNLGDTSILISVCFRPNKSSGKERFTERKYYDITYNFQSSHISIKPAFKNEEDSVLQPIVQAHAESSKKFNEPCPLWSCIRALLERASLNA
uniref:Mediator of RNA polymerase II transcription subunit 14 n=1 Tax=Panagrolaimus sp. JU765 TaxID=591449 RepID=A0AC34QYC4_9BILA